MSMNRFANCKNQYQGERLRVLCVCSAGLLRSPTAAVVLAKDFNRNTRSAGSEEDFALIYADDVLLTWADEIVCMTINQKEKISDRLIALGLGTPLVCLGIQDDFSYMDPALVNLISTRYKAATHVQ